MMDKDVKIDVGVNLAKLGLAVASLVHPSAGIASATIDTAISVFKAAFNIQSSETDIVSTQLRACVSKVIDQMKRHPQNKTQEELLQKYALPRYAWWNFNASNDRMSMVQIDAMVKSWFDNKEAHNEMYLSLIEIKEVNEMFLTFFQQELPNYPNLLSWISYDNTELLRQKLTETLKSFGERLTALEEQEKHTPPLLSGNVLHKELWDASRRAYFASKREGNRFSYDIIDNLLPHGYIPKLSVPIEGRNETGQSFPLADLCNATTQHVAIIGNGGIGKTTFLQKLMDNTFSENNDYSPDCQTPFFIELNQCPVDICNWHISALQKTNFITRYIACLLENHTSLNDVTPDILSQIEKEFQQIPDNGKPQYLLLLDGFNEVKIDERYSIRSMLSNEISVMKGYANVRIITTSRETQGAYYAHDFQNFRVSELKEDVIIEYLRSCGKGETYLSEVRRCKRLMECLGVPLYLCMFASSAEKNLLPESHGEILYYFFHRNSSFYSLRKRDQEIRNNPLTEPQTKVVLDFILPYIGFHLESNDIFSINSESLEKLICEALVNTKYLFTVSESNPFQDFNYRKNDLRSALDSLMNRDGVNVRSITMCAFDYLGVIYQFHGNNKDYVQRIRYAFTHHSFRDYFSAMWSIQLLRMMPSIGSESFHEASEDTAISYHTYLNTSYWSLDRVSLISEILMEHRNKPIVDPVSKNWRIPDMPEDLQGVLTKALDYCRKLTLDIHYFLRNILSTILYGRKELTMLNLSELDLSQFSLNNVICSRKGHSRIEGTSFCHSILSEKCLQPETHQDNIIEYLYNGDKCLTLDFSGLIKVWDIRSGKLEHELYSVSPSGNSDYSSTGYMKCSRNGTYLGVKSQESTESGMSIKLFVFDMSTPQKAPMCIIPSAPCHVLSYFAFSDNEKSLVVICDKKYVYFYDITGALISSTILDSEFHDQNEIVFSGSDSYAYILSNNYSPFDDYDEEDEHVYVVCDIHRLDLHTMQTMYLDTFLGEPSTMPVVAYFPGHDGFLVYEGDKQQITYFDCRSVNTKAMFVNITKEHDEESPAAFHTYVGNNALCYIMYPDCCYLVDVDSERLGRNAIIKTYHAGAIQKKLHEMGFETELLFYVNVNPAKNTFLLFDDNGKTYEWNSETDVIRPRYNSLIYETAYLAVNPHRTEVYLVHSDNGISQFGGSPLALQYQHCYQNQGYSVSIADSDFTHNRLALAFADLGHEKVVIVDLETYEEKTVFATWEKFETITDLCFCDDGTRLLITTQYRCVEILLDTYLSSVVADSKINERFAYASYYGNGVAITVIESDDDSTGSRCEYYEQIESTEPGNYQKIWYYLVPELSKELFPYFICANGDFGKEGPHNQDGIQKYWLTRGFFLEKRPEFETVMSPKCYVWDGERFNLSTICFDRLDMICVRHKHPLATSIGKDRRWTFMYLDSRTNEAILAENQSKLAWTKDLSSITYQEVERLFARRIGNQVEYSVWSHVVPWNRNRMVGVFELNNIQLINHDTAEESELVDYEPGYSLCGCNFEGIIADADTLERINRCGGRNDP